MKAQWIAIAAVPIIAGAAAGTARLLAQPPDPVLFVRERSASHYGGLQPGETIALAPMSPGPGRVFVQPLSYSGAVRLHFQFAAPLVAGEWTLRIVDGSTVLWSTTAAEENDPVSFWSEEVRGVNLAVEVQTSLGSTGLAVAVDKIAIGVPGHFVDQATTAPRDCKTRVETMVPPTGRGCQPVDPQVAARVRSWSPSIARLRLVADDGEEYFCSGFLVAADLLLTNWHCVQSTSEVNATWVDFDYDNASAKTLTLRFKKREFPPAKTALDFTVLRLKQAVTRTPLRLVDTAPDSQALAVIQHPDGEPKQVSIEECRVTDKSLPGADPAQATDFGHFCDTIGGSSGSATQDVITGDVIGLHHLGFRTGSNKPVNQAVRMSLILDAIRNGRMDLFNEIKNARP